MLTPAPATSSAAAAHKGLTAMLNKLRLCLAALALIVMGAPVQAQNTTGLGVATCGMVVSPFVATRPVPFTVDVNGVLCTSAGGGGGGSVTQGTTPWIVAGQGTAGTAAAGVVTVQGIASMTPLLATLSGTNNIATVTSLSQFAGNAIALNAGAASAGTLRSVTASDSPEIALLTTINTNIQGAVPCFNATAFNTNSYTNGQTNPANCDLNGNLYTNSRVVGTGTAGTAAGGVLTIQGVASMTKLLVTPDSVALPANQSVNVAQINGVTPLMGNGVSGTGAQRFALASDNTAISTTGFMSVKFDQTTDGTTNAVSAHGAVNVTPTNCGGTITTGGTAQNAHTAQSTLRGMTIANLDTSEVMWISFTSTAASADTQSYPLAPATATTFAGLSSYSTPLGYGYNTALSVIAATTGHKFACTRW